MIDMRRPKSRRNGERDGSIDWHRFFHETIPLLVVCVICMGIIFWAGRHTYNISLEEVVAFTDIYKEYKLYHVFSH